MNYWNNAHEYKEIKRVLNDYWITQKDTKAVHVKMEFINKNDGYFNEFYWFNPTFSDEIKISRQLKHIDERIESLQNKRRDLIKLKEASERVWQKN